MNLDTKFMREAFVSALGGVPTTILITCVTLLISIPLGFLCAMRRIRGKGVGTAIIKGYVSIIRGTPVVLQIMVFYSLLPTVLNYFLNVVLEWDVKIFDINPILYAYVVFSLNTVAVLSEVFRSALLTVGRGQLEAALSVGLTRPQAYRRIIVPQAAVAAIPNVCNTTISLLKSTSLVYIMTVKDIMAIAKLKAAYGYKYIEAYLVVFLIYIILCTIVQLLFKGIEKYFSAYKKLITA